MHKTVAEFFAGMGLMRLGLESQGWRVTYANDIAPDKEEIYTANFGTQDFIRADINSINGSSLPTVTLATASFPCTDLSLAGARAGLMEGKQSSTFWAFTRILEELNDQGRIPPLVLIENVTGFLTSRSGEDFRAALRELNRLGYAVDTFILDASWFVPQSRIRLFVVGIQKDLLEKGIAAIPPPVSEIRPVSLLKFIQGNQDILWTLKPLLPPEPSGKKLESVLESLPDGHPDWWSRERADYLYNQMSERHQRVADFMRERNAWSYGTAFRRMRNGKSMAELRTDGIAGCLRTPKGGSGRQILVRAGFNQFDVRLLTARECARLMGAAENYRLEVPLNKALFALGDAVCVPAVEWIVSNYLNPIIDNA